MPFQPIPGSRPLTITAAIAPPLVYFFALVLLPPFNHVSPQTRRFIAILRVGLALLATILFARLPLKYHVPWSCGLTYILNLTGWYGCTRVIDIFFITGRHRIPRRVKRKLKFIEDSDTETSDGEGAVQPLPDSKVRRSREKAEATQSAIASRRKSFLAKVADRTVSLTDFREAIRDNNPVSRKRHGSISIEKAVTDSHQHMRPDWGQRFLYAIDLETSMRGVGWSWTTADIRHSKRTWLPTLEDEFYQLFISDIPMVTIAWALERYLYRASNPSIGIRSLNWLQRGLLTLSQGVFLFGTFSAGYTAGAILTSPLRRRHREWTTHNLAYWPPLNSQPLVTVTTVREFWSRSWHRLFMRLFLVWGVWPGQYIEEKVVPSSVVKRVDPALDIGKVLGAFFTSGIVHAAAGIAINGGHPSQTFEWLFFWCSGLAVVFEEAVQKTVHKVRGDSTPRWYDPWVGRIWTITVLLWSGQYFTRGWYDSGLVEEMVTLPVWTLKQAIAMAIQALQYLYDFVDTLL